ncbi:MAG: cation transporter [Schwartzia sp.]|nr:cation transporter [Schwartzia sp. (in: firmicutes)]
MKKKYKIEVDCADCARKMEDATAKVEGVAACSVGFMAQKMTVEFADGAEPADVMPKVVEACKKVEPDCEVFI